MMKPAPVAALVVAEAELLLELLVIPLDPPARLGNPHAARPRRAPGQIGEPVRGWLCFAIWPRDQPPLLQPRLRALRIAMGRADPHGRKARGQRALGCRAPGEAAPSAGGQMHCQCLERHRLRRRIAVQSGGWASATGPGSRRQRPVAGWPDAGAQTHAKPVELGFKRLKSVIGLHSPPGTDARSARPYILGGSAPSRLQSRSSRTSSSKSR